MPVGNSDRGVGLWAGQVMLSLDNVNQHIDWWHEAVPGSGETFDHEGTLTSLILSPTLTVGLSNYWNITISQQIGSRIMTWGGDTTTIHHRNENSLSDFTNAFGGLLGDTQMLFRYLIYNDGKGSGKRLFLGGGIIIPSKNTITKDPFFLNGEQKEDHRHFSMSEGVYKGVLESQYYKKRKTNPVFIGGSLKTDIPLKENKYGYKASFLYQATLTGLTKQLLKTKVSLGGNFSIRHTTKAFWNNKPAPNSESTIITFGGSFLYNVNIGVIGLAIQKPVFLYGGFAGTAAEEIDQKMNAIQFTFSYRRLLDFVIPWIDPLKGL